MSWVSQTTERAAKEGQTAQRDHTGDRGRVSKWSARLEDEALLLLGLVARQEGSSCSMLEHLTDTLVGLGRALEVLVGTNLLLNLLTILR